MTVFVHVNTSKQVGDADHLKVFANLYTTPKWWRSNTRFWNEPDQPPHHHVQPAAATQ